MTIATPTASSLKLRFKEFATQSDTDIEFAIEEAMLHVDDSWSSDRAALATAYLAAHFLMVTISRAESGTGQRLKSESMDGMTKTYDTDPARPDPADYTSTSYGARFLELLGLDFPPVLLV